MVESSVWKDNCAGDALREEKSSPLSPGALETEGQRAGDTWSRYAPVVWLHSREESTQRRSAATVLSILFRRRKPRQRALRGPGPR